MNHGKALSTYKSAAGRKLNSPSMRNRAPAIAHQLSQMHVCPDLLALSLGSRKRGVQRYRHQPLKRPRQRVYVDRRTCRHTVHRLVRFRHRTSGELLQECSGKEMQTSEVCGVEGALLAVKNGCITLDGSSMRGVSIIRPGASNRQTYCRAGQGVQYTE